MNAQLSLGFRPSYVGHEAWTAQIEALREAVLHLGHKEVSFELDIAGSYLSDALNERDRKRWAAEWTLVVLAMLEQRRNGVADAIARRILESSVQVSTFVIEPRDRLTAEDIVAALERDPDGREAIARVTKKKGRR